MKNIIFILSIACLFASCSNTTEQHKTKLDRIAWLSGFWKMTAPEGTMTESWSRSNDSSYLGIGKYMDTAGNVLTTEEIQIVLRKDELWYIPTVSNQNGGQPVAFKEASFADTMVVFENKGHDFPQRIVYVKKTDNNVLAYIEGEVNGKLERFDYQYVKQ